MATTLDPQSHVQAPVLEPVLPERFALRLQDVILCAGWALLFMYLSYVPLFVSDIWGHVNYGHWILDHRTLPLEDPFTPLCSGVPVVDTAWLGQVVFAFAERMGGAAAISNLFALTLFISYIALARACYLRSGSLLAAHVAVLIVMALHFGRHAVVRPENFGSLCFTLLLWIIASAQRHAQSAPVGSTAPLPGAWKYYCGIGLLFVGWANLHGSFPVGLALLACMTAGRAIEVVWTSNWETLLTDRWVRRWLFLTELAAVAVLVNPYGIDLYINVVTFGRNENLKDILEWYPVKLIDLEGLAMSFAFIVLLALWRHSRARVQASEVLMLALFAASVAPTVRMISWFACAFGFAIAPHLGDVVTRLRQWSQFGQEYEPSLKRRSFRHLLIAGLLVWIAFAFCPFSDFLLSSKPRKPEHLYAKMTPLEVTAYLKEHPPVGQVMNAQWWGDWLVKEGPPGLQVFMTTNAVHVAPRRVWRDYMAFSSVGRSFTQVLERYSVNTVVLHKSMQQPVVEAMRRLPGWSVAHEDELGIIFTRNSAHPATIEPAPEAEPEVTHG